MKKRSHKRSAGSFRQLYFISQQDMADYLDLSPSLLAMWERGLRSLPTRALVKLAELNKAQEKVEKIKKTGLSIATLQKNMAKNTDSAATEMLRQARSHRYRAQVIQQQLESLASKQEAARKWLDIIDERLASIPVNPAAKVERLWLELQQMKTSKKLLKAHAAELKLQLQAEVSAATAGIHEEYHRRLKK